MMSLEASAWPISGDAYDMSASGAACRWTD